MKAILKLKKSGLAFCRPRIGRDCYPDQSKAQDVGQPVIYMYEPSCQSIIVSPTTVNQRWATVSCLLGRSTCDLWF